LGDVKTITGVLAAETKAVMGAAVAELKGVGGVSAAASWSTSYWSSSTPIGYWDMSDGSGTTVSDVSDAGNNLDGEMHASPGDDGPAWDSSNKVRGSNSLLFNDGDSDRVIVDDNSALDFNVDDAFSISCWIKRDGSSGAAYGGLVCKMAQTSTADDAWEGYALYMDGSQHKQPRFLLYDGSGGAEELRVAGGGTTAVNDTDWHHLVVTYDGTAALGGVAMYLDGSPLSVSQVADTLETDDDILTSTDMIFGAFINNTGADPATTIYHFDGNMDEIAIWSKALSSDEVSDVYNDGDGNDVKSGIPKSS